MPMHAAVEQLIARYGVTDETWRFPAKHDMGREHFDACLRTKSMLVKL